MTDFTVYTVPTGSKWEGWFTLAWRTERFPVQCDDEPKQFDTRHQAYVAATNALLNSINTAITSTETQALIDQVFDPDKFVRNVAGKQVQVQQKRSKLA